ncbi:MAG: carbamoyltransferase HypF [Geminocystis sp.]|nr:carbamoyltransferase HypF [Geminocystis sp.]HIK37128.1 carbamoyltransferase HypF [Geminocystis sp. M7585_C2015_104]MCS7147503.1 carbamoyltransferase HypF [Geminocystis sp.]MCX8077906.1 carbamoyltransferase HypF [Geminocystis sp.]MDW8115196.1 carbamoyltransferase HypF [Geminocystis sp.]
MKASRYRITITGLVQGVGFRPFVYRLAEDLCLKGWVRNSGAEVEIEVECSPETLSDFLKKIREEKPPHSSIERISITTLPFLGYRDFQIQYSIKENTNTSGLIVPDLATCKDCLRELLAKNNRRYRYPFINCTNCGPRYSIIKTLPYDRINTTMGDFLMCGECQQEYHTPSDRRFHAQPNACPKCGPHLQLWDSRGEIIATREEALQITVSLIREGYIVAVKGLGGFHLVVDAANAASVTRLRKAKNRPHKPFAVMYPDVNTIEEDCYLSETEKDILLSPASPIVLLKRRKPYRYQRVCEEVSPGNPYLGVMLPYTPLHHLLLHDLNSPIVATSGNRHSETICIDEKEALIKLNGIADYFLIHNRPIFTPVDDSVVAVVDNQMMMLRLARGYTPLSLPLPPLISQFGHKNPHSILALGGHLKSSIALALEDKIVVSQYLGDLDSKENRNFFQKTIDKLTGIYDFNPDTITCDSHPDYYSSYYAEELVKNAKKKKPSLFKVQHHIAHIFSVIAENNPPLPVLGVAWDGTGYGLDNTIWGGEFFLISYSGIQRVASFCPFPLLGGETAIFNPIRISLGLVLLLKNSEKIIAKIGAINRAFSDREISLFKQMLKRRINCPFTSSVGRLFDGISALLGLGEKITFEGQAAMNLEFVIDNYYPKETYCLTWHPSQNYFGYIYWQEMLTQIISDYTQGKPLQEISAKFHLTLAKIILDVAQKTQVKNVVVSGGCFQNRFLLAQTINQLRNHNFNVFFPQRIPTNDGGISVGQIAYYLRQNSCQ